MLISSVVIVLREVLEAALLISILLATSQRLGIGKRWLAGALAIGISAAVLYAHSLARISEWFDGVGQEVFNAGMQFGVCLAAIATAFMFARRHDRPSARGVLLPWMMATAVVLATAQEGAEIYLYVSGFLGVRELALSVGTGSVTGAGIGFSVGVLFYYLLLALRPRPALLISLALLALSAANMCRQAVLLLIQADWLQVGAALWDTSSLVDESSIFGQLLYALVGYEATPSVDEVGGYLLSLAAVAVASLAGWYLLPLKEKDTL